MTQNSVVVYVKSYPSKLHTTYTPSWRGDSPVRFDCTGRCAVITRCSRAATVDATITVVVADSCGDNATPRHASRSSATCESTVAPAALTCVAASLPSECRTGRRSGLSTTKAGVERPADAASTATPLDSAAAAMASIRAIPTAPLPSPMLWPEWATPSIPLTCCCVADPALLPDCDDW